jgi:hypothetical protein
VGIWVPDKSCFQMVHFVLEQGILHPYHLKTKRLY